MDIEAILMPPPQPRMVVGGASAQQPNHITPSVPPFLPSSNDDDLSNLLDHEGLDSDDFNPSLFDLPNNALDDGHNLGPMDGLDPGAVESFETFAPQGGDYGMDGVVGQQFSELAIPIGGVQHLHTMPLAPAPAAAARQMQPKKRASKSKAKSKVRREALRRTQTAARFPLTRRPPHSSLRPPQAKPKKPSLMDDDGISPNWEERLKKSLKPRAERKPPVGGKWSAVEDARLKEIVESHGAKNWKGIAEMLGTLRNDVQCLHRWNKVLKPGLHKGPWSGEEVRRARVVLP